MLPCRRRTLAAFTVCWIAPTAVHSIQRCGQDLCRDDEVCCAQGDAAADVTCCKKFVDMTYYNIAMVTRKLSGILIMLLLFAVGYFVQRMLCSKSRQLAPAHSGHPTGTTSQEPLVENCATAFPVDPGSGAGPSAQLPAYHQCKLPTYEETVRDGGRGPQGPEGRAT